MARNVMTRSEILQVLADGGVVVYKGKLIDSASDPDLPADDAQILVDYPVYAYEHIAGNARAILGYIIDGLASTANDGDVIKWDATNKKWILGAGGGGGISGLTVGTTSITSGTAGRLFYETGGNVLGETSGYDYSPTADWTLSGQPANGKTGLIIYEATSTRPSGGLYGTPSLLHLHVLNGAVYNPFSMSREDKTHTWSFGVGNNNNLAIQGDNVGGTNTFLMTFTPVSGQYATFQWFPRGIQWYESSATYYGGIAEVSSDTFGLMLTTSTPTSGAQFPLVWTASGVGINKTSALTSQLHVVSGNVSRSAGRFESPATAAASTLLEVYRNSTTLAFKVGVDAYSTSYSMAQFDVWRGTGAAANQGHIFATGYANWGAGQVNWGPGTSEIMFGAAAGGGYFRVSSSGSFQFNSTGYGALNTPDAAFVRAAANIIRVSNASTGAGKIIIGPSTASTTAADLYVIGSSASLVPFKIDSAPTPSVDVLQVSADNGTTAHFVVTSTGAPHSVAGTNGLRYGSGSAAASSTRAIAIGVSNNAGSGTDIISIGYGTALGGAAGTNITIGNSNSHSIADYIAIGHGITNSATKGIVIGNGLVYQYAGGNGVISTNFGSSTFAVFKAANMFGGNGVAHETAGTFAINGTGGYGTDKVGGDLYLVGGRSTGSAVSGNVTIKAAIAGTTGSTMNPTVDRYIVNANRKALADALTNLFEISLPALKGCMGTIKFEIFASDGTDVQVRSGIIHYNAVNKGGAYTKNIVVVDEQVAASSGTLTASWNIVDGTDKITVAVTPSGSLTETTYYILYTIENNSEQAITIL